MRIEIGRTIRNFVIFVAILAVMVPGALASSEPSYIPPSGAITVDGNTVPNPDGEWDLTNDFFALMDHNSNNKNSKNSKNSENSNNYPPEKLYLRYDCDTETLYAMVQVAPGSVINPVFGENWVKVDDNKLVDAKYYIYDVNGGIIGWEALGTVSPGAYNLKVHSIEIISGESTGETFDVETQLLINCGTTPIPEFPTVALPIAAILGLMFIFGRKRDL